MCPVGQSYLLQLLHKPSPAWSYAAHAGKKREVLVGRQVFVKVGPLYDRTDLAKDLPPMGPEIGTENFDLPAGRGDQGEEHTDRCRFTRTVLPQEAIYIRGLHRKGQVVDSLVIPEMLCKMTDLDDRRHRLEYQCNLQRDGRMVGIKEG
jgi:hypothetical protein